MTTLLESLADVVGFIIDIIGDFATFLTTNTLGFLILGVAFAGIAFKFVAYVIALIKR